MANVEIGVAAMTASAVTMSAVVRVVSTFVKKVNRLVSQTAVTPSLRLLRQGRNSLSAVPGDSNFNLGGAYALA